MSLILAKPAGQKLTLAKTYVGIDDPDAASYIALVEAADTAAGSPGGLETATKVAIHSFVKGCKADGIWPAIKASCILAGARTLNGALVPLVGTAPTNVGPFVAGDYNRKTGLIGNGSTKYLNSNRANNADPQNSKHLAVYSTQSGSTTSALRWYMGDNGLSVIGLLDTNKHYGRINDTNASTPGATTAETGMIGVSRASGSDITLRLGSSSYGVSATSSTPGSVNHFIFCRNDLGDTPGYSNARLAFYSIGESLDLAKLDARVTAMINAFGAALP